MDQARGFFERALALDPGNIEALVAVAEVHNQIALALDPNLALAHAWIGAAKYFLGRGSESEIHIREMLRLSPRDTFAYAWMAVAGVVKLTLGSDEEAVTWLQRAVEANPSYPVAHFWLASAGAFGPVRRCTINSSGGTCTRSQLYRLALPEGALSSNPTYLALRERIHEGMHKAGVPEG